MSWNLPRNLLPNPSIEKVWEIVGNRYIVRRNNCWEWIGPLGAGGYGHVAYYDHVVQVSRLVCSAYHHLDLKAGRKEYACHNCDNRKCINPSHIYRGNASTNRNDAFRRGRIKRQRRNRFEFCFNGHRLNPKTMYMCKAGYPVCRICRVIYNKRSLNRRVKNV